MYIADASQIRQADRLMMEKHQMPGLTLMENAGRKSAEFILNHFPNYSNYLILAGPGNNGGDGLVIARYLSNAGKSVKIMLAHDPQTYKGDALQNWNALPATKIDIAQWNENSSAALAALPADTLIIDALLGTGVTDALRNPFTEIIEAIAALPHPVVAIDLPSGLNASTGEVKTKPLTASHTLTFHLPKVCHWVTPASNYCGEIITIDIGIIDEVTESLGIHRQLITAQMVRNWIHTRVQDSHKGTFGHALIAGGCRNMAGAPSLASRAALAVGAGLSSAFIPGSVRNAFFQLGAEVMTLACGNDTQEHFLSQDADAFHQAQIHKNAVAIGPGMGLEAGEFLQNTLPHISIPLVLDADALNHIAANDLWPIVPANSILTPHPGEMARLTHDQHVNEHRLEAAEKLAKEKNVLIVLKGKGTIVAFPDGTTFINSSGNAGMATAGAGDVLTGAITGLLAQGYPASQAVPMAVFIHGVAGDLAAEIHSQMGVTAERILEKLGAAIQAILTGAINEPQTY